ncbi:MAG: GDSL-type esterase/lipase family protein [Thomasclavelia sp.]|nr:GDSL-type esterase/lipase family protein [Thomasclavelia sp.]
MITMKKNTISIYIIMIMIISCLSFQTNVEAKGHTGIMNIPVSMTKMNLKVAKSKKKKDSYFKDTLFIGNSLIEGFRETGLIKKGTFYGVNGYNVDQVYSSKEIKVGNEKMYLSQAIKLKSFKKIYLEFGINEIEWPAQDIFIQRYEKVIKMVKEAQPQATIFIMSLTPIAKKNLYSYESTQLVEMNKRLYTMCENNAWFYIDIYNGLVGNDGYISHDLTADGLHFKNEGYKAWKEYLLEHTLSD